jgi:hypothetical protein
MCSRSLYDASMDREGSSAESSGAPRPSGKADEIDPFRMTPPDGSASVEQRKYGPEEVHSVLTPAGQIDSVGQFYRGLGPRRTKILLFGTLGFILAIGILTEFR